jgi:hypothetical protein
LATDVDAADAAEASVAQAALDEPGLIYSRGRVDYVAITSSSGACDGASVGFQLLRAASVRPILASALPFRTVVALPRI